jgi:acylphosphatase
MTVCRHVFYSGHVQGVGFRYTARRVAQHHVVAGMVRNLPDGRVELVAEGDGAEVDSFLDGLRRQMAHYIHQISMQDEPPRGLTEFRIEP